MNKEYLERIGRMSADHLKDVEKLENKIKEYEDKLFEIEAFHDMKTAVIDRLKEDDLSGIPNEYKEMFIERFEKTKYRFLESIAKSTEKAVHTVYKNWALTFANIIIKHALESLSYINKEIDPVTLQKKKKGTEESSWNVKEKA